MTQETAAPAEALLQAQTEVMRQYHGDLLQTIYWGVGTVVIVAFAMAAFNWVTSRKSYKAFHVNPVIFTWKKSLANLLDLYDRNNRPYPRFFALLFLAFVAVNLACYWFAMFTVFPEYTQGMSGVHYFKVQFPVGFLGAVFDSFSFFITIFIVRRALRATSGASYVAHLSVDLLIAIVATWWTLFVFTLSGGSSANSTRSPSRLSCTAARSMRTAPSRPCGILRPAGAISTSDS